MNDKPNCPKCGQPLQEIRYPSDSMLNRDQWESQLPGDLFCTCHNNHKGNKPYAYFWKSEFESPASGVGETEREAFEKWARTIAFVGGRWSTNDPCKRMGNCYYYGDVEFAWQVWQAARSAGDAPREWIPVSERLPEEEELVLFAARCQADDCDGITHTWNEVFRGSIYSTPQQIIATADNGDEYEGEEILGWQPFPAPPVVDSGAIPAEEEKAQDFS